MKHISIGIFILPLLMGSAKTTINVFAQVDKSEDIYVGEKIGYHIIIDGDNKAGYFPLKKYYF
jgi:hypothetical protein